MDQNKSKPTIFLFISDYVQVTDMVNTGFLRKLAGEFKVIVFTPTMNNVASYPVSEDLYYIDWNLQNPRFFAFWKLIRMALTTEFDHLLSVKVHYKRNFKDWRRRFLHTLARFLPFKISVKFIFSLESLFLPQSNKFKKLVLDYKPRLVVVGTPGFSEFEAEAILLARESGLKTAAINFSWDNLTTNAKHIRATDFLIVWNSIIRREAIEIHHYDEDRVTVSGSMRFDHYFLRSDSGFDRERFLEGLGLDIGLPVLLITTTSHGVYPYHRGLIENILNMRDSGELSNSNIIIRVHPKDDFSRYSDFSKYQNVFVERAGRVRELVIGSRHRIELERQDLLHLKNLFQVSDVAINYASTITLEALLNGCPVVNFDLSGEPLRCHHYYEHYKPILLSGAVPLAHDRHLLAWHINAYLKERNLNLAQRERLIDQFFPKRDGRSMDRVIETLKLIVSSK